MPIHHAVLSHTLGLLIQGGVQFSQSCLTQDITQVTEEDLIRFPSTRTTNLGDLTSGGSPLSLATYKGYLKEAAELLQLGYDPNISDAYMWGMNPFHLALMQKDWK